MPVEFGVENTIHSSELNLLNNLTATQVAKNLKMNYRTLTQNISLGKISES